MVRRSTLFLFTCLTSFSVAAKLSIDSRGMAIAQTSQTALIAAESDAVPAAESLSGGAFSAIAATETSEPTEKNNGLFRLSMLGLGLSAVVSSFGIGFFVASRSKKLDKLSEDSSLAEFGTTKPSLDNPIANSSALAIDNSDDGPAQIIHTRPFGHSEMVEGLIQSLQTVDPEGRRKVIWELGQCGQSPAVQPLVDLITEADSKEKSLILGALSEMGVRSLRPLSQALTIAFQDDNPEVRKNAIRDLSRIYDLVVHVSHLLGRAVEDSDADVRQTAKWGLEQLGRIRQIQDFETGGQTDRHAFADSRAMPSATSAIEFGTADFDTHRRQLQS